MKKWKPKEGKKYWRVIFDDNMGFDVGHHIWVGSDIQEMMYRFGFVRRTKKEAVRLMQKFLDVAKEERFKLLDVAREDQRICDLERSPPDIVDACRKMGQIGLVSDGLVECAFELRKEIKEHDTTTQ